MHMHVCIVITSAEETSVSQLDRRSSIVTSATRVTSDFYKIYSQSISLCPSLSGCTTRFARTKLPSTLRTYPSILHEVHEIRWVETCDPHPQYRRALPSVRSSLHPLQSRELYRRRIHSTKLINDLWFIIRSNYKSAISKIPNYKQ